MSVKTRADSRIAEARDLAKQASNTLLRSIVDEEWGWENLTKEFREECLEIAGKLRAIAGWLDNGHTADSP